MRKVLIAAIVFMAFVVAAEMFVAIRRWRGQQSSAGAGSAGSAAVEQPLPPVPNISLQINEEDERTEFQGTPLILSVRLANQRAINAQLANQAERMRAREIEEQAAQGRIPRAQADAQLASLNAQHEAESIVLGDDNAGWEQYIHFAQVSPQGEQQPLSWRVQLADSPASKSVTLDGTTAEQLDYLVSPGDAAQIAPGEYQILAFVEVPPDAAVQADRWRGRALSYPVKLTIAARPAHWTPAQIEQTNLQLARYDLAAHELPGALQAAQTALGTNPHSIAARILTGQAQEEQGNIQSALTAYRTAQAEFQTQFPRSYEPPMFLIYKIHSLGIKIETNP